MIRKFLIIFIIQSIIPWQGIYAAYNLVASTSKQATGCTAGLTTTGIDTSTPGADLIVVAISYYGTVPTLTDSQSNGWTQLSTYGDVAVSNNHFITFFYKQAPSISASHTFTLGTEVSCPCIFVGAFTGSASTPFDLENGVALGLGTSGQPGAILPNANNELVVFALDTSGDFTSVDIGSLIGSTFSEIGGTAVGGALAYSVQTTATSINPTWTTSNAFRALNIAGFKAAAAGGGAAPCPSPFCGMIGE